MCGRHQGINLADDLLSTVFQAFYWLMVGNPIPGLPFLTSRFVQLARASHLLFKRHACGSLYCAAEVLQCCQDLIWS